MTNSVRSHQEAVTAREMDRATARLSLVRMAMFLCKVEGIDKLFRFCPDCHAELRDQLTESWKIAANRISCDGCAARKAAA